MRFVRFDVKQPDTVPNSVELGSGVRTGARS
jgi:hypothetical protein